MASFSSAQTDLNDLSVRFNQFQSEFDRLQAAVDGGAGVSAIATAVLRLREGIEVRLAELKFLQDVTIPDITDATDNAILALYNEAGALRDRYNDLLDSTFDLTSQAGANDNNRSLIEETQPKNSAGDIVEEEAEGREETASPTSPPQPVEVLPPLTAEQEAAPPGQRAELSPDDPSVGQAKGSNADVPETSDNANLDTEQGQATSQVSTPSQPIRRTQPGEVADSDDSIDPQPTTVGTSTGGDGRAAIAKEFLSPIVARENILSGLSSSSYSLSLYLMNIEEYGELIASQKKVLPSKQLIAQSAGAAQKDRNQWFNVDFFIEDLRIESVIGTQATGSPHNAVTLEFNVVEPQGITFLNRLNNAVIEHTGGGSSNAFSQVYLMVIRFYGYNASGLPVTAESLGTNEEVSDSNSIVEKFIPFIINNFNYTIDSRATEYQIQGTCVGTQFAFSTERASIPFNLRLTATDIQTLLNGNVQIVDEQQADENAEQEVGENETVGSAPQGLKGATITQGLAQALNKNQQLLVNAGSIEIPDEYEIVIENIPGLRDAKLSKPGRPDKKTSGGDTPQNAASLYLADKTSYDKETKTYNIIAGTQIVQLIDLVMRTSTYITSQQNVVFDEKTGKAIRNAPKVQTVQWYRVRTQVTAKGYDKIRNTIAFKMKYIISRYQINTPRTPYYPPAVYRGVHKIYPYWFTGQNSEVIDFKIEVNNNYWVVIGNDGFVDETPQGKFQYRQGYSSAPGGSLQGGVRQSAVPAANLSDRLYSPYDVAEGKITIVGDPDWLQQSEIFYNKAINLNPFMPDGSVNYDSSEVLFEMRFNPVVDYDLASGQTYVYENNTARDSVTGEVNIPQEQIVWAAVTVTSYFQDGKFFQDLVGMNRDFKAAPNAPGNDTATIDAQITAQQSGAIDYDDQEIADQQEADGLETWTPINTTANTPLASSTPNRTLRLQSSGSTTNFNVQQAIDAGLPFRDTQIDNETVRIYGSERDLIQYFGPQAVPPKPNAGENLIDSDAGDLVSKGFI